jgi:hypothetical protein
MYLCLAPACYPLNLENKNLEMVNMNMIVNTSELVGHEAEIKTTKASGTQALAKLIATWEKKTSEC